MRLFLFILMFMFSGTYKTEASECPEIGLNIYQGSGQTDTINLNYITDKNYVFPTLVAISSGIQNKNPNSKYHYYIIGVELSDEEIKRFTALEKKNVEITVVNQQNLWLNKEVYYKHRKVARDFAMKADLFKFQIADIFPNIDKMLYMDGDTIVQKDLTELFNTDISDVYAGAVKEISSDDRLAKSLNIPFYFNVGVMLLNLEKMRKDNIAEKLCENKFGQKPSTRFMTQDTINKIFFGNYVLLPAKNNLLSAWFASYSKDQLFEYSDIDDKKYQTVDDYVNDATIIHFIMEKPWNDRTVPYGDIWWKYYMND